MLSSFIKFGKKYGKADYKQLQNYFIINKALAFEYPLKIDAHEFRTEKPKLNEAPIGDGKYFESEDLAVSDIPDGAKLLIGGIGLSGYPQNSIDAVSKTKCKDLTVISNTAGFHDIGLKILLTQQKIKKYITSYVGVNPEFGKQYLNGNLELEFTPQGVLAERLRAGGAGIPAFYTPTGYGTVIQEGNFVMKYDTQGNPEILSQPKPVQEFNGRNYIMETAITGDFALVKAWKADKAGNLVFRKLGRNFNSVVCKAAKVTIVEAEEIVEIGQLDPDNIHVPGIYVDRIFKGQNYEKYTELIKKIVTHSKSSPVTKAKEIIIRRTALEFKDGRYINLGLGIPTLAAYYVKNDTNVSLHFDAGVLKFCYPGNDPADPDLMGHGVEPMAVLPGTSFFSCDECTAMITGGHLDVTILGGMQVSKKGDLANWMLPGSMVTGMGGAMDLVSAPRTKVIVTMEHTTRDGSPKIMEACTLPLTGQQCVDMIITDLGVFEVTRGEGLRLIEIAPDVDINTVINSTGCQFSIADDLKIMGQIRD
ncbi:succinyl-CoA:3-ketoacid-coenzyme A transferase, mitochondrial [Microplitis demolitor]|uniref:succinyl-CoA:3-ketoacid-coenzyme A transferase, mitochondrial n=1 Tax=Microplitis demolitor TaxID=69319 RepID=UPI0004CCE09F|nr:succinyl-CoA:3-ketoacid-coenzyme A transferase, mitochondrial [Microplitis demolitor]